MLTAKKNISVETDEDPPIVEKPTNKFLFVENTSSTIYDYHYYFLNSVHVNNILDAKELLKQLDEQDLPELVVLDIPLNILELNSFKSWLKNNFQVTIPMVYNESALALDDIKLLFSQKLVDDIVNLPLNYKILPYKAKFIKKVASLIYNKSKKDFKKKKHFFSNWGLFVIKRSIDLILSLIAIIFCLPVFILIALAIRLESKGPVIYIAKRAGRGFKVFKFYKFRTMVQDADKNIKDLEKSNLYTTNSDKPSFFKLQDDPRVTKVGAFLRNSSLDELPQLFNVLRGDMSIVGNRPLPLYEAASLTTNEWAERFMAPAGITGLWQVQKRGQKNMSAEERLELDINYARNNNIARDFWIMAKTPSALIQKTNV